MGRSFAVAFLNRALLRGGFGDFEGEIASYGEFVDLFRDNDAFAVEVVFALGFRSLRQAELGATERALISGCAELDGRLEGLSGARASWIRGLVLGTRATALTMGGGPGAAVEAFRRAVEELPAGYEFSMRIVTRLTLNLTAVGAPERELLDVLARDRAKTATLAPLMAALRERLGEGVRVPEEVRSVASDVRRQMEERTDKGRLIAF